MGMESYYINLIPLEVKMLMKNDTYSFLGRSQKKLDEVIFAIKEGGFTIVKKDNFLYELDSVLIIRFSCEDLLVKTMVVQGCFTWFEDGLRLIYSLANYINKNVFKVYVNFAFGDDFEITNETNFLKIITEGYKEKHDEFINMYGSIRVKQTVGEYYLKRYKAGGIWSTIKRLFGK